VAPPAIQDSTIESVLRARAETDAARVGVRSGAISISYGEIVREAEQFARWLVHEGVEPGGRVALWLPNGVPWVNAHVGIAMAGAVCVPVSTRLVEREVAYILAHSESRVLVTATRFLSRDYAAEARTLASKRPQMTVVPIDPDSGQLPARTGHGPLPGCASDDAAMVQYTSGTTGFPKGCMLSHRAWTNNARLSAEVAGLTTDDVIFSPSPFFHLFGSLTGLMGAFAVGAPFITMPKFDAVACVRTIKSLRVTRLVAVPTMWLDIMSSAEPSDVGSIWGGLWGGAGFPRSALERAMDLYGWNLQAVYGMTEAPTLSQVRPDDSREQKLESVGRATPHIELRIVDPGTNSDVPLGEVGEIWARGYNRMLRYLDDPAATEARLHGDWLRSGDLGQVDRMGYLRVVGRLTDMIVVGGANVYAREVEDVLTGMAGVALAAVVGRDDSRLGEVPVAWVVSSGTTELDAPAVLAHCKLHLAAYKVPREVYVVPHIPLTASGKIHKAQLREWANKEGH
jgi:acyl-CoA synthetase (AMP-forming)/AMP-acid ligase II